MTGSENKVISVFLEWSAPRPLLRFRRTHLFRGVELTLFGIVVVIRG